MTFPRAAVAAVWFATLAVVVVVVALVPEPIVFAWLALTLALAVILAILGQLVRAEQSGFVVRLASATCGSFAIVLLAALAAALIG